MPVWYLAADYNTLGIVWLGTLGRCDPSVTTSPPSMPELEPTPSIILAT